MKEGELGVRLHLCPCLVAASVHVPSIDQSYGHRLSRNC